MPPRVLMRPGTLVQWCVAACLAALCSFPAQASPRVCKAPMAEADTPSACFSDQLRRTMGRRVSVETPPAHELFYIAMALTPAAEASKGLIRTDTPYHRAVLKHFARWRDDPFVDDLQAMLSADLAAHMEPKINAAAYDLKPDGRLKKRPQYTWIRGDHDSFAPLIADAERFARRSSFGSFYRSAASRATNADARTFYEDEADLPRMLEWLGAQFPDVAPYDHIRVVVSPLTAGWQHQDTVRDGAFRELILNVDFRSDQDFGPKARKAPLFRSFILFTELNHGSINPMGERYEREIRAALAPRMSLYNSNLIASAYNTPETLFLEYLNWGLIPLYACDTLSADDCAAFEQLTRDNMAARGEFPRYAEFQAFLLQLYRSRSAQQTLSDRFPEIIQWFAADLPSGGGRQSETPRAALE